MELNRVTILKDCIDSRGNEIVYSGSHETKDVEISFYGEGNKLVVDKGARLERLFVGFHGNGAEVFIGKCNGKLRFLLGSNSQIHIGDGLSTTDMVYMTTFEGARIVIGKDCMFAGGIQIRADDAHPIFDIETGDRINRAKSIVIGEHVWLGEGCIILNGTSIGSGTVVGIRSVVKGIIPNNCIAAGVPARIVRKNIAWERPHFSREFLFKSDGTLKSEANKAYWNYTSDSD